MTDLTMPQSAIALTEPRQIHESNDAAALVDSTAAPTDRLLSWNT